MHSKGFSSTLLRYDDCDPESAQISCSLWWPFSTLFIESLAAGAATAAVTTPATAAAQPAAGRPPSLPSQTYTYQIALGWTLPMAPLILCYLFHCSDRPKPQHSLLVPPLEFSSNVKFETTSSSSVPSVIVAGD